jgi:hypothetical protein
MYGTGTAVKILSLTLTNQPNFDHCCFLTIFLLKMQTTDYNDWESNIFIAFHYLMLANFIIIVPPTSEWAV